MIPEKIFESPTPKKVNSAKLPPGKIGTIALSYPPFFIDNSGAEFHAD